MKMVRTNHQLTVVLILLASFAVSLSSNAAERTAPRSSKLKKSDSIAFFSAMQSGKIDVQLIPKNSKRATILIRNNTKQPLKIQLPAVFAGIPALRQGMMGGMGGGMGGGGMGGGGMGGGGMGGGMFNLAPEKAGKIRVTTVCLEHGKKEPNPHIKYLILPIEMFAQKPEVIEIGKMLSTGKLDQSAAQAAVWHYTDNLSWSQLARKVGVQHLDGSQEPYFQPHELNIALRLSAIAQWRVRNRSALQQTVAKPERSLRDR